MSDISRKVFSIEPEPDEDPIAIVPEPVELGASLKERSLDSDAQDSAPSEIGNVAFVSRPIIELVDTIEPPSPDTLPYDRTTRVDIPAVPLKRVRRPASATTPPSEDIKPIQPIATERVTEKSDLPVEIAPARFGWVGPLFALLTGLSIGILAYGYMTETERVSTIGRVSLVLAFLVPLLSVTGLWAILRAATSMRRDSLHLATVADRLTRADDAVVDDVRRMSDAIRHELSQVDAKLAQSRADLETLSEHVRSHSDTLTILSDTMAARSVRIKENSEEQSDTFEALSSRFNDRMTDLTTKLNAERDKLETATDAATDRVTIATASIGHATQLTEHHAEALERAATSANAIVTEAEARLSALSTRIAEQSDTLDTFFEQRIGQMTDLSDRLSAERPIAEDALQSQTQSLSAVDAQIELTEGRLSDLLEHARTVQVSLSDRLTDIDTTLSEADRRSRAFTADIADRVSDSVAQTRREMSLMESDLRALQSRMETAADSEADAPTLFVSPEAVDTENRSDSSGRLHLTPLDTDFPSLEGDELSIPVVEADPLDLVEIVEDGHHPSDIVRRPGSEAGPLSKTFGRRRDDHRGKDWQWRDMLGSIDTSQGSALISSNLNEDGKPLNQSSPSIQRPGPGIPLSAPAPKPQMPEGSDVVARLCEVELAPSAVVDEATIKAAEKARRKEGEIGQSSTVFSRLNAPILHLRGVLSADLEFRLRAEGFRREFDRYLSTVEKPAQLRADFSTAPGRAYLLCAAALSSS